MQWGQLTIEWDKWNLGGRTIFIATCIAIISFLLTWKEFGPMSQNGISEGMFLLGIFYIYPIFYLLKNQFIETKWGILCGVIPIISTIIYISSLQVELFGGTANISGIGSYLFLISSIALIIGVIKYETYN
jgi:hypothetical protein